MRELVFYHEEEGVIVICGNESDDVRKIKYIQSSEKDPLKYFMSMAFVSGTQTYPQITDASIGDDFILLGEL